MLETPQFDPEVSGTLQNRNERTGVLGAHRFAMVLGAVGGVALFAALGSAIGGTVAAFALALIGLFIGAFAGRAAAIALRPNATDRSQRPPPQRDS